ncbi:hypothetical protein [Coleofasciculus sp. FACHB-712]|uniref:hypothetical protein n=1 Tax=Coleofasciculus sp. FACHB-712 TaxID=2692789 RepID=UPI001A7ECDEB|nr:hypothetical protein [Coleofasciculus sp. FACHB-712]
MTVAENLALALADLSLYENLQKQNFPIHGNTGEAVIHAADAALYKAKAQGRDRVSVCH